MTLFSKIAKGLTVGVLGAILFISGSYTQQRLEAIRDRTVPVSAILVEQCGVIAGLFLIWNDRPMEFFAQDGETDFTQYIGAVKQSRQHAFRFHVPCPAPHVEQNTFQRGV